MLGKIKLSIKYSRFFDNIKSLLFFSERENTFNKVLRFVSSSKIEGDYLEFGVYKGTSFSSVFLLSKKYNFPTMRFFAFDSFEGLPEIKEKDDNKEKQFETGSFSFGIDNFKKNIRKKGVDLDRVTITKGWFDKVLNEKIKKRLKIKKAAIINVDCDLYESTVPVLEFITDYIQDGTVILFDDWFCFRGNINKGEQKAFYSWLNKNKNIRATEFHRYDWHGMAFILNID
jgi:O-methyltransferase